MTIAITKTQERNGEQGACWEVTKDGALTGNWIQCELEGDRTTLTGDHHTYHVIGYTVYLHGHLDGDSERFFSVKEYGSPHRALQLAKVFALKDWANHSLRKQRSNISKPKTRTRSTWIIDGKIDLGEVAVSCELHRLSMVESLVNKGLIRSDAEAFADFIYDENCNELTNEQWNRLNVN